MYQSQGPVLLCCQVPVEKEDMYHSEALTFVEAIRSGDRSNIHSSYPDAVETYKTSLWITTASSPDKA